MAGSQMSQDGEATQTWAMVYTSSDPSLSHDRALVLRAAGIEHQVIMDGSEFRLLVHPANAFRARRELDRFDEENPPRPPPAPALHYPQARGVTGVIIYALLLVVVFRFDAVAAFGFDWLSAGRMQAIALSGEAFRAITALTLHLDAPHLVGNLVFGAFFGYLAGQHLGSGVAWLAILAAGGAGNLVNAWWQSGAHRSVGASTAVFAALGVVVAYVWWLRRAEVVGWARRIAPLVGGVVMLAWFGTGDARTDIAAHLAGFLAGLVGGVALGFVARRRVAGPLVQAACGALALGLVAAAWLAAAGETLAGASP